MSDINPNDLFRDNEPKIVGYMPEPQPTRELTARDYAMWSLAAGKYAFRHARDGGRGEKAVRQEYKIATRSFNEARYLFESIKDAEGAEYADGLAKLSNDLYLNYWKPDYFEPARIVGSGKSSTGVVTRNAFTIPLEKPETASKEFRDMVVELVEYDGIERNCRPMPGCEVTVISKGGVEKRKMSNEVYTIPAKVYPKSPGAGGVMPAARSSAPGYKTGNGSANGGIALNVRTSGPNPHMTRLEQQKAMENARSQARASKEKSFREKMDEARAKAKGMTGVL